MNGGQGPAREVGGLGLVKTIAEVPDGTLYMYTGGSVYGNPVADLVKVTPDGKQASDTPGQNPTFVKKEKRHVVPANWLDTSLNQKWRRGPRGLRGAPEIWPYGRNAVVSAGKHNLVVWQRHHTGGSTGSALVNGDIRASRVDGWKPSTFTIAQHGTFNAVGPGHEAELRGSNTSAAVIVGVQADDHMFTTVHMTAEPLDLVSIDIGSRHLYRCR